MPIIEGLKAAAEALRQADKIPQFQAVLDAQAQIVELQVHNQEQQLEIQHLRQELERVQADQPATEGSKIWVDLLWIPANDDPYCVHSWDQRKRLFHVNKVISSGRLIGRCHECKSETLRPPPQSYWQWKQNREPSETADGCTDKPSRSRGISTSV
jgi:hypothetical protein